MPSTLHKSPGGEEDGGRKRVGKACDRCRIKKSKCDGTTPCSRCTADNETCVFGNTQKKTDKVYPKGFPEMLENDRLRLIKCVKALYQDLKDAGAWHRGDLPEGPDGFPLTHHILEATGALALTAQDVPRSFEDDLRGYTQEMRLKQKDGLAVTPESPTDSRRSSLETPPTQSSDTFTAAQLYTQTQDLPPSLLTPQESPITSESNSNSNNYFSFASDNAPEVMDDSGVENMDTFSYDLPPQPRLGTSLAMATSPVIPQARFPPSAAYSSYHVPQYTGYSGGDLEGLPSGEYIDPRQMITQPLGNHLTIDPRQITDTRQMDPHGMIYDGNNVPHHNHH